MRFHRFTGFWTMGGVMGHPKDARNHLTLGASEPLERPLGCRWMHTGTAVSVGAVSISCYLKPSSLGLKTMPTFIHSQSIKKSCDPQETLMLEKALSLQAK